MSYYMFLFVNIYPGVDKFWSQKNMWIWEGFWIKIEGCKGWVEVLIKNSSFCTTGSKHFGWNN